MRLLFLGDIVGRSGRNAVVEMLPGLRRRYALDFVVINGENAAGGFGITEEILLDLYDAGADVITLGNHSFDQREALVFIARHERLLRPLNYPEGTPGRGTGHFKTKDGAEVLVINAMGRIFMEALDCPFRAVAKELEACPLKKGADAIILDIHAEASSEKKAIAYHFDGELSLVVGTHTHVPTADDMILPGGTAFITDVGMCGDYDSIIGMEKEEAIQRFLTRLPGARFKPSLGPASISGIAVETDDGTGLAKRISPLRLGAKLRPIEPDFWIA
ncbi:MAG: TIGR00282 family metallophosphoesterase [Hyphomicrobiaceae bacterium]|nr:MAG: TIGR00282 family metallophosphoesterase [Hyphomicrobiaceae bacterium]